MLGVSDSNSSGYDEFGLFGENIDEFSLGVDVVPPVARIDTPVADGTGGTTAS